MRSDKNDEHRPDRTSPVMTPAIARRLSAVSIIIVASMALGIIFYREPFRFFEYPLSDLGATRTEHDLSNIVSMFLFDGGMLSSAVIMFSISRLFGTAQVEHRRLKRGLTLLSAIGFIVITFPYNINDNIHMSGDAALVGGLWGLTVLSLLEMRESIGTRRFVLLQLLLQGTILPYAAMFAIGLPIKQAFQKPAVAGLILAVRFVVSLHDRVPAPEDSAVRTADANGSC